MNPYRRKRIQLDLSPIVCAIPGCGNFLNQLQAQKHRKSLRANPEKKPYCSYLCSCQGTGMKSSVGAAVREPETHREVLAFHKTIAEGRRRIDREERDSIRAKTPSDDSPEAEKAMRAVLAPNPSPALLSGSGFTDRLVKVL